MISKKKKKKGHGLFCYTFTITLGLNMPPNVTPTKWGPVFFFFWRCYCSNKFFGQIQGHFLKLPKNSSTCYAPLQTMQCGTFGHPWRSGLSVPFAVGRPGVHSPCRVIPKDFKKWHPQLPCLALGIYGRLWRTSRQVCLLCPWARHLMGRPAFMWKTGDP